LAGAISPQSKFIDNFSELKIQKNRNKDREAIATTTYSDSRCKALKSNILHDKHAAIP